MPCMIDLMAQELERRVLEHHDAGRIDLRRIAHRRGCHAGTTPVIDGVCTCWAPRVPRPAVMDGYWRNWLSE
jgi:hypothetical protein